MCQTQFLGAGDGTVNKINKVLLFVISCYVKSIPKLSGLKQQSIYYLTISAGQKFRQGTVEIVCPGSTIPGVSAEIFGWRGWNHPKGPFPRWTGHWQVASSPCGTLTLHRATWVSLSRTVGRIRHHFFFSFVHLKKMRYHSHNVNFTILKCAIQWFSV